jgi:hypothetical protein
MNDSLALVVASGLIALVVAVIARQVGIGFALPVMVVGAVVGSLPVGPNAPLHPEIALLAVLAPLASARHSVPPTSISAG